MRRSKRPATDPLWRITAPAVLRPPFPLTFLLSVAVATWKRDASALREVRTTPFPAALAAMSIERSLASPEYLNAWMFCGAPRQREFGRGVGGGTDAEVSLLGGEDAEGSDALVEERVVALEEEPLEVCGTESAYLTLLRQL